MDWKGENGLLLARRGGRSQCLACQPISLDKCFYSESSKRSGLSNSFQITRFKSFTPSSAKISGKVWRTWSITRSASLCLIPDTGHIYQLLTAKSRNTRFHSSASLMGVFQDNSQRPATLTTGLEIFLFGFLRIVCFWT